MSDLGHNGGPPIDWRDYGGFIVEARDSRSHHLIGYGKQVRPADADRGFCYSVNEAWRDLLHECRYADGYVMNGGRKMLIERGSMIGAVSWIAHRWNWSPQTVRTFLDKLELDGMISRGVPGASESNKHVGKVSTVISVRNYDVFQSPVATNQQTDQQTNHKQATNEQQTSNNKIRNNKVTKEQGNKEEEGSCAADAAPTDAAGQAFEVFWELFPAERRRGKGKCRDLFRQIVSGKGKRRASADVLIAGIRNGNGVDPEFPPMPETWLNQGRWEDAPPEASKDPSPVEGKSWGWWRGMEPKLRGLSHERWTEAIEKLKPNGTWPWWMLGAPPGHPECVVPEQIVTDRKWSEKYGGKITNV